MNKSILKSKGGRPKTFRTPVLVRLDRDVLRWLDKNRKWRKVTRPEMVRVAVEAYRNWGGF